MKLVECVPNFSEGRNMKILGAIAEAIRSTEGARLLDVDSGAGANRTVYTFAGPPGVVLEAAFNAIRVGTELIDMREHEGVHPRMGACDVCPFVPLSGITMDECVKLANRLGERVGGELGIPVYLYGEAAKKPERGRLPDIREGEYEALEKKLASPKWRPDYGPAEFNAKTGATAIGARPLLVAFNINLDTKDVQIAKEISREIRTSGNGKRRFDALQAKGWFIPEYDRAQVTTNILNIDEAPLYKVFDTCSELAQELGTRVTGSEIVGMVPRRALAGDGDDVNAAIDRLGLNDVGRFDPARKIIEQALGLPELTL